jgi:hypothetical protein
MPHLSFHLGPLEIIRVNQRVALGLTVAQLGSLLRVAAGITLAWSGSKTVVQAFAP